jgi:hypothetical protein
MDRIGDEDPAWVGQGFDPSSDVDTVAVEVVALDNHIAEIDADAQFDTVIASDGNVPPGHCLLDLDRAAHPIDYAGELHQHSIAGGLDDPAMVLGDFRIDKFAPQSL